MHYPDSVSHVGKEHRLRRAGAQSQHGFDSGLDQMCRGLRRLASSVLRISAGDVEVPQDYML